MTRIGQGGFFFGCSGLKELVIEFIGQCACVGR
jgi:hypothetical protein